jgi:hypothetical protein
VEYSLGEDQPFDIVPRGKVAKIVYESGKTVEMSAPPEKKAGPGASSLPPAATFLEIEAGWNSNTGIGLKIDHLIVNNASIEAGLGLGAWGFKASGGARYYFTPPFRHSLGAALSYSFGSPQDVTVELEVNDGFGGAEEDSVDFSINPCAVVNLTYAYDIEMSPRFKLCLEAGYGISLNSEPYTVRDDRTLTKKSRQVMDIVAPGGVVVSLGLGFAIF